MAHLRELGFDAAFNYKDGPVGALLRTAAPSHVEAVQHNFVQAVTDKDFQALGRAFAAVLSVEGR